MCDGHTLGREDFRRELCALGPWTDAELDLLIAGDGPVDCEKFVRLVWGHIEITARTLEGRFPSECTSLRRSVCTC